MNKPEVNPEIYKAWDNMQAMMEERRKSSLFPSGTVFPKWNEAYPLMEAVRHSKGTTGRNRKQEEQLVLVPRFVLKFLLNQTLTYIASYERKE